MTRCRAHHGRRRGGRALCLPLAALLAACSLLTSFDESKLTEDTFERCRDRTDNDNNGLVDCDDPSCSPFDVCRELTPDSCNDGVDNDKDGATDCADPGCAALAGVCAEQTAQACADGVDNDGDGAIDCKDSDCRTLEVCRELTDTDCSDGVDNDKDGMVDCNDFDCYAQPSCCTIKAPEFTGDSFAHQSTCTIHGCVVTDPTCCQAGYQTCNPFDPDRWVAWGLPRAMQALEAFVTNEPCGCESSGIVSVERVVLAVGTRLRFDLALTDNLSTVCGGFTVTTTFVDDQKQCSGKPQPGLLLGVCLEGTKDGGPRLVAVADGVAQQHAALPGGGPVTVTIEINNGGALISAGALRFQAPSPESAVPSALVLIYGKGRNGRLEKLTVTNPRRAANRCQAPADWYRHLARGEPVVGKTGALLQASDPTVVYLPELKSYLMLFVGKSTEKWNGIFSATSADGVSWTVSDAPVMPASATDTTFGTHPTAPTLLSQDGRLHVWYTREDESGGILHRAIAHATSDDGKKWKPSGGPLGQPYVLEPGKAPAWDSLDVYSPSVVATPDGALLMMYNGLNAGPAALPALGVARSKDGTLWERVQPEAAITPDPNAAALGCEDPFLLYDAGAGLYRAWYGHRAFGQPELIRYAVSTDGISWTLWPGPVLETGQMGTFDERGVTAPTVVLEGVRLRMWYTGLDGMSLPQVGYAENRGGWSQQ